MEHLVPVQVTTAVGSIEDNLDAVEASIRAKTEEYKSIVVTENSLVGDKQLLADIRKEKTTLDQQRKDIKSAWMKPYEQFEARAKAIIALYDEPIAAIDDQLKGYEVKRVEEKKKLIAEIYDEVKEDLGDWIPLEKIYQKVWENKGTSKKKIREDMALPFEQLKLSISTIQQLQSEFETDALEVLKSGGNLQEAIAKITALKEQKERFMEQARLEAQRELEAKQKAEEEEKARKEAERLAAEEAQKTVEEPVEEQSKEEETIPPEEIPFAAGEEETYSEEFFDAPFAKADTKRVSFYVTDEQLEDVKMFLASIGIEEYEVN